MSDTALAPARDRQFAVAIHDGHTWVLDTKRDRPIGYFEGEDTELGETAAGILGLRASQIRQGRHGRAQAQSDKLTALPGWQWWRP